MRLVRWTVFLLLQRKTIQNQASHTTQSSIQIIHYKTEKQLVMQQKKAIILQLQPEGYIQYINTYFPLCQYPVTTE